jgi:hypothetical protein
MRDEMIHHGVSRHLKQISVIACILTREQSVTRYIVTSQASEVVLIHLKQGDICFDIDFVLKARINAHINADVFNDYISNIILPFLNTLWSHEVFAD